MTKQIVQIMILGLFLSTFIACNKDNDLQDLTTTTLEDVADIENIYEESSEEANYRMSPESYGVKDLSSMNGHACATITRSAPLGTFPNTTTIDFGTGCTGQHGRSKSGKIIITTTDEMHNAGATRTITFDNHYVDDVKVEGVKTMENQGLNADGLITYSKTIVNGVLTFPNGTTRTWNSQKTIIHVQGANTINRLDDTFSITGNTTGTNRNGENFTINTTSPLVKKGTCRWIVSGVLEVSHNSVTKTLDYGGGNCDDEATVSRNGRTKTIKIRKKRH